MRLPVHKIMSEETSSPLKDKGIPPAHKIINGRSPALEKMKKVHPDSSRGLKEPPLGDLRWEPQFSGRQRREPQLAKQ